MAHSVERITQRCAAAAVLAGLTLLSTGCFKATAVSPKATPGESYYEWSDFFLGGAIGQEDFDVREFCPAEAASVSTSATAGTMFVTLITAGVYAPRLVTITCAEYPPQSAPAKPGPATAAQPAATAPAASSASVPEPPPAASSTPAAPAPRAEGATP